MRRVLYWLDGWRKHKNCYVDEAIYRRGLEGVRTYIKGLTLMLTYKDRQVVFPAARLNKWGDPADFIDQSYTEYIQQHVDEVSGIRWTFKYDQIEYGRDDEELD